MAPARSMLEPAMTPAARVTWSRAVFRAMVKLARSGSVPGTVGGVGDSGAEGLVGDQQGVNLLLDAAGGTGAEHPAAEDRGFQLEVGGLDFPALMVEDGQVAGGVAGRVGQGGDEPAVAGEAARAGGHRPASVDDPDGDPAEQGQPGPVGQPAQDGELRGAVPGPDPDQEVRLRRRDLPGQGAGAEPRSASSSIPACRLRSRPGA